MKSYDAHSKKNPYMYKDKFTSNIVS